MVQLNRSLPWRQPTNERRKAEQVRPIFWANRPKSYINTTSDWDKYPQGRYGFMMVGWDPHQRVCEWMFAPYPGLHGWWSRICWRMYRAPEQGSPLMRGWSSCISFWEIMRLQFAVCVTHSWARIRSQESYVINACDGWCAVSRLSCFNRREGEVWFTGWGCPTPTC